MAVGRLIVKIVEAPGIPGNRAIALCTEDGVMLPMQVSCSVANGAGECGSVTATFHIDGKSVMLAG